MDVCLRMTMPQHLAVLSVGNLSQRHPCRWCVVAFRPACVVFGAA